MQAQDGASILIIQTKMMTHQCFIMLQPWPWHLHLTWVTSCHHLPVVFITVSWMGTWHAAAIDDGVWVHMGGCQAWGLSQWDGAQLVKSKLQRSCKWSYDATIAKTKVSNNLQTWEGASCQMLGFGGMLGIPSLAGVVLPPSKDFHI